MSVTLFDELRAACGEAWQRYVDHPFVRGLAEGTLPQPCFSHYLTQDYLFLLQLARAYGLAAFKAERLEELQFATRGLSAIIDHEVRMHVTYCAGWGLSEAEMAATSEAGETMAYTRFVLDRGMAGDLLDLLVALAPCIVGYGEIGRTLLADPRTRREGNPYGAWIETYAAADYQAVADGHIRQMDAVMRRRGSPARRDVLIETFRHATRLEADFWTMGLHPPPLV